MKDVELTPRQAAVLRFIVDHTDAHGYQPSCREIGLALGIRSTNGVYCHLVALEKKGRVELATSVEGKRRVRAIRILRGLSAEIRATQKNVR